VTDVKYAQRAIELLEELQALNEASQGELISVAYATYLSTLTRRLA